MNFSTYLENIEGILWNDFDENYSGAAADEIISRYEAYCKSNGLEPIYYDIPIGG